MVGQMPEAPVGWGKAVAVLGPCTFCLGVTWWAPKLTVESVRKWNEEWWCWV